jgi:hypothetical protein
MSMADRSGFRRACVSLTGAIASASLDLSSPPITDESALPPVSGSALPSAPLSTVGPQVGSLYVRTWFINASIGPDNFWFTPTVVSNGKLYYQPDATSESPARLYRSPLAVPISPAGIAAIAAEAQRDGLLGAIHSFECPHTAGGGQMAGTGITYLQIKLNGVTHDLSGGCASPADEQITPGPGGPTPGTYYAFMDFVAKLHNMSGWLGYTLGTPVAWDPVKLVVIASLPYDPSASPPDDPSPSVNAGNAAPWLVGDRIFDHFGTPYDPTAQVPNAERCGIVTGADLAAQLPSIKTAHEDTLFVDSKTPTHQMRLLAVRPLFPDEIWTYCGS